MMPLSTLLFRLFASCHVQLWCSIWWLPYTLQVHGALLQVLMLLQLNAWLASIAFHSRDVRSTEVRDFRV